MIQMSEVGIKKVVRKLEVAVKKIKSGSNRVLQEMGQLGQDFARNLAPFQTGELRSKILNFPGQEQSWIIVSKQTNDGFPLNVAFDEGNFGKMTMFKAGGGRQKFRPKRQSSIGFMKQTKTFLEKEFSKRLNLEITRIIE